MTKLYLAGPIPSLTLNPKTGEKIHSWRTEAEYRYSSNLNVSNCIKVYNPEKFEVNSKNSTETVNLDLAILKQMDCVLANIERESTGTAMEICYAKQWNIPVVICCSNKNNLSPWHIYHATKIVDNIEDAYDFIDYLLVN